MRRTPSPRFSKKVSMTSLNPSAFACSAFAGLVVLDMACFAPKARANCVTALPIDPPIAGARTVLPSRKPARVRATCAVKYAGENRMVERRDAGRSDSHQHFPVCDRWFWKLDELQRFISTKLFRSHGTHVSS